MRYLWVKLRWICTVGSWDLSLKLSQDARTIHLEVISMTELWHLSAEWRDLIELLVWGSVDRTLSSHQAHGFS